MKTIMKTFSAALALILVSPLAVVHAEPVDVSPDEARWIASEAHAYTYPLVLMDITRRITINSETVARDGFGPMNHCTHMQRFRPEISGRSSDLISIRFARLPGSI